MIKQKNEETLQEMQEFAKRQLVDAEREQEEHGRNVFSGIVSNLHHLVSTATIPGVYNNPKLPEEQKPQVYNSDIETHLQMVFKVTIYMSLILVKLQTI